MKTDAAKVMYVLVMIAVIVGMDLRFFRNQIGLRLLANVVVVLVFGAAWFLLKKR